MTGTGLECHTFLLITSRKWCLLSQKKKNENTELLSGKELGVGGSRSWCNGKKQTMQLALSFWQRFSPLFSDTVPPHPKSPAGGLDTTQTQHIPNMQLSIWRKQNRCKHRSDGGSCKHVCATELVSANPFCGSSTTGHLFILQRRRNVNGFIKVLFPPADCCDQTMWMTTEIFEEKKWLH